MKIIERNRSRIIMRDMGAAIVGPIIGVVFLFIALGGINFFSLGAGEQIPVWMRFLIGIFGCLGFFGPIITVSIDRGTQTILTRRQRIVWKTEECYPWSSVKEFAILKVLVGQRGGARPEFSLYLVLHNGDFVNIGFSSHDFTAGNLDEIGKELSAFMGVPFVGPRWMTDEESIRQMKQSRRWITNLFGKR
ncbi:MAG: hypothetical protein HY225_01690 [Candidatus Vogelbacteria bacterium]|nr:hypothetical protein [Candidatus Vogelbacteria bacterium]